jgi:hypothetical protein
MCAFPFCQLSKLTKSQNSNYHYYWHSYTYITEDTT